MLIVDDSSPDGTAERVDAVAASNPRVKLLKRPGKMGLGSAYIDGFKLALAEGAEEDDAPMAVAPVGIVSHDDSQPQDDELADYGDDHVEAPSSEESDPVPMVSELGGRR